MARSWRMLSSFGVLRCVHTLRIAPLRLAMLIMNMAHCVPRAMIDPSIVKEGPPKRTIFFHTPHTQRRCLSLRVTFSSRAPPFSL
uniref:Putative secreted protein n=1 Tax=Anopheles darlingi TaxID=43151 RepID=A0A2M4DEK5_ANODA